MNQFFFQAGWCLVAIAAIFSLGLMPRFARRFYPEGPNLGRRLAAPAIFAVLAAACFAGVGFEALVVTAVVGSIIVARWRWQKLRSVKAAC